MSSRLSIEFSSPSSVSYPLMVLVASKDGAPRLSAAGVALDKDLGGALSRAIKESDFKGEAGEDVVVRASEGTVILFGIGEAESGVEIENLGGQALSSIGRAKLKDITLNTDAQDNDWIASFAYGAYLAGYHFSRYFTKGKSAKPTQVKMTLAVADKTGAEKAYQHHAGIAAGVFLARDLVSEPSNILYPAEYAERCKKLTESGIDVEILNEAKMQKLGMNLLLAVGQGSDRESRMVVMRWQGGKKSESPIVLVGKGVCFDTGGISIKPAGGMEDMKWDMGGSAAVVGTMQALAKAGIKRNVIGLVGLVENMPDGKAIKPGDVVKSMSGQSVEIINTDAEGRLVLADVLTYAQRHCAPSLIIDLATLTGAILVSLGMVQSGLFSNNDTLAEAIQSAGTASGEATWRMPLGAEYNKLLASKIADMKNIGGRYGGSVTAACFLERFIENSLPWAHLDIAGMAWANKAAPTVPLGGTGYGVRLLTRFIADFDTARL